MNAKPSATQRPQPPSPSVLHRQQMLRQVWLPLAASLLLVLALVVLTLIGAAQASPLITKWGNLAAVYIILPVLFVGLLILALLGGSIYGVGKLLRKLPYWMLVAQTRVAGLAGAVRRAADAAVKPIFAAHLLAARARALRKQIFH